MSPNDAYAYRNIWDLRNEFEFIKGVEGLIFCSS